MSDRGVRRVRSCACGFVGAAPPAAAALASSRARRCGRARDAPGRVGGGGGGAFAESTRKAAIPHSLSAVRRCAGDGEFVAARSHPLSSSSSSSSPARSPLVMRAKNIKDLGPADLSGKRVLVRSDLNVPLNGGAIADDTRVRASVPTIRYLVDNGAKVLVSSHLGRPKGGADDKRKYSLAPVAARLGDLLGKSVPIADDCVGDGVTSRVSSMRDGDVLLLENVRFHAEEEKNDAEFAKKLAANADLYVNDAFGSAHRAHGSTAGVTEYLRPSVAGFLLEKELDYLAGAIAEPKRPFAAVIGGSKVSSKIGVIETLLEKCDKLIIGGGMVFTFLKARGYSVGSSLVEEDKLDLAKSLEAAANSKGVEIVLPTDVIVADAFSEAANTQVVPVDAIPDGWMGLDNGPESTRVAMQKLAECNTILWNGPMGVFEFEKFSAGTFDMARALADLTDKGAITIIGGGDSVAAVEKAGLADRMSHISTGGGAALELIEGRVLPGVAALDQA